MVAHLRAALLLLGACLTMHASPPSLPSEVPIDWAQAARQELTSHILPFWSRHAPRGEAGFWGEVGGDLQPNARAPRSVILQARLLWTFSAAFTETKNPEHLTLAQRAFDALRGPFHDSTHGGFFWALTPDDQPTDLRKQIYGQVFALYGLSEYHRVTGSPEAKTLALETYALIEAHGRDPRYGGYVEVCARDWQRSPVDGRPLMGVTAPKSQNTNLHVLEAFTALMRIWPDPGLKARQRELIQIVLTKIIDPATHHLHLFLNEDWSPRTEEFSYGHDIEVSWLLVEAAEVLGDEALLQATRTMAVKIADTTLAEGMDADGGIFGEGNRHGVTKRAKEWWPQAEAVVGFLNAYQISGDKRHLRAAEKVWHFIQTRLVDREKGEWFQYAPTSAAEKKTMPKISFWKCPYHNSRACLEVIRRAPELR